MSEDHKLCKELFKKYSKTYYYSSWLFPEEVRHRVYVLYAFVRLADELVDNPTSDPTTALHEFTKEFHRVWEGGSSKERIIEIFVHLAKKFQFERTWIEAFLISMEMDLYKKRYTQRELDTYIYGSAEVIGLMMCRLMGVDKERFEGAQALGAAMQMINFIRDIHEDRLRGRIYMPEEDLQKFQISEDIWMKPTHSQIEKKHLQALLTFEIEKTTLLQKKAERCFSFLPKNCLLPVKLAAFTYYDTLLAIKKNPLIVFERKLTSTRRGIFLHLLHLLLVPTYGSERT